MAARAEFEVVGPAAKIAEEWFASGQSVAMIAIAHGIPLEQRKALIARRPKPGRGPEPFAINSVESRKPEDFVGCLGDGCADVRDPPFGVCGNQHAELWLTESFGEFPRDGKLEVVSGFLL